MSEKVTVTLPATVERIIKSPHPAIAEKAQIAIEGADDLYREIRIENNLTDENGDEVRLKQGAHVEVTVAVEPEATIARNDTKG
jgi:uncharacterized protein YfaS (alpha-2-macroglobulin family)